MRSLAIALFVLASCGGEPASMPDMATRDIPLFTMGCMSGDQDGNETDIDCGGSCAPCTAGKMCNVAADCDSGVCFNRVCSAAACNDSVKNGTETDIDCGGMCPNKCADGKHCKDGVDCQSGGCANNVCAPSLCSNMQQDGMETDVDCGGPMCMGCTDGKKCSQPTDCMGLMCVNNVCGGGGGDCMNMMKDGTETDVDCGGGTCGKCGDGRTCGGNQDCASSSCSKGRCCPAGFASCGNDNMCSTSLRSDPRNCGGCGVTCPMNNPLCVAGKCRMTLDVLLVHSEGVDPFYITKFEDIQKGLMATGAFGRVDGFDGKSSTPTVQQLQMYDSVLVFSDFPWADPVKLGDNLAAFVDAGGYVVTAIGTLAFAPVGGRFGNPANGYLFLTPSNMTLNTPDSLGVIHEPQSPLMKDIKALMAQKAFRINGAVVNGGTVVAEWGGKSPLIVRGTAKGRNRTDLNFFPVSSDIDQDYYQGDGALLVRNALLFR